MREGREAAETAPKRKRWRIALFETNLTEVEERALVRVVRSGWLSRGPVTEAVEGRIAALAGEPHALFTNSCTAALHLAFTLAGVRGREVIVPSMTFIATANAALLAGARVRLADVASPLSPVLSADAVRSALTPDTAAVAYVCYNGSTSGLAEVAEVAAESGAELVLDAAHVVPGAVALAGFEPFAVCHSFYANKTLTSGEGGALVLRDAGAFERARALMNHGLSRSARALYEGKAQAEEADVTEPGFNARATELQAALLLEGLGRFGEVAEARKRVYERYLAALKVEVPLADEPLVRYVMPVLLADAAARERVRGRLTRAGVQTAIHYKPLHAYALYSGSPPLPTAEDYGARTLSLPFYDTLTDGEVDEMAAIVNGAV